MSTKRKQYIIDKKFQLRTTFSIIGIVASIVAIIVIVIGISMAVNNRKMDRNNVNIDENNQSIRNINEIQDNVVHFLSSRTLKNEDKVYRQAIRDVAANHTNNMKKMKSIMTSNDSIMTSNREIMRLNTYLLIAIILVIIIGTVILYFQLIRKTHRISGPIYVMSMYMREIIEGRIPEMRKLRTNDELMEFYDLFQQMVVKLKGARKGGDAVKKVAPKKPKPAVRAAAKTVKKKPKGKK